jgi:Fe2+ transport system protein FeoA
MPGSGDRFVPLDSLATGARARVRALQAPDDHALLGLAGLGLLPGVRLEVLRRVPVLCVRLDGACYAIDRDLARGILVEAEPGHGRGRSRPGAEGRG